MDLHRAIRISPALVAAVLTTLLALQQTGLLTSIRLEPMSRLLNRCLLPILLVKITCLLTGRTLTELLRSLAVNVLVQLSPVLLPAHRLILTLSQWAMKAMGL